MPLWQTQELYGGNTTFFMKQLSCNPACADYTARKVHALDVLLLVQWRLWRNSRINKIGGGSRYGKLRSRGQAPKLWQAIDHEVLSDYGTTYMLPLVTCTSHSSARGCLKHFIVAHDAH